MAKVSRLYRIVYSAAVVPVTPPKSLTAEADMISTSCLSDGSVLRTTRCLTFLSTVLFRTLHNRTGESNQQLRWEPSSAAWWAARSCWVDSSYWPCSRLAASRNVSDLPALLRLLADRCQTQPSLNTPRFLSIPWQTQPSLNTPRFLSIPWRLGIPRNPSIPRSHSTPSQRRGCFYSLVLMLMTRDAC